MSAWKWMARICSKTPWMKTWSLRVYYWWKKLQYQKGYVEKEEINPKKVIFEAYMGKKYACSPKALYQAMCRDPQYQDWELLMMPPVPTFLQRSTPHKLFRPGAVRYAPVYRQ